MRSSAFSSKCRGEGGDFFTCGHHHCEPLDSDSVTAIALAVAIPDSIVIVLALVIIIDTYIIIAHAVWIAIAGE